MNEPESPESPVKKELNETETLLNDAMKALNKLSKHFERVDKRKMYKVNKAIHILWWEL